MFEFTNIPKGKHTEMNEDRRYNEHPGYVVRNCKSCGKEFLAVNEVGIVESRTCGRDSCNKT